MVLLALACAAVLLATAPLGVTAGVNRHASDLVYGICLLVSLALLVIALVALLGTGGAPSTVTLPLGLPWLGAHFRLDALAAFFLAVVGLGAAAASLFALGYGRHEQAPGRVLPFFPAFLAGMSMVVLADDAFTFLVSWEFMSLSSWALVMAHHRVSDNIRAGYIYLIMASFGTLALLLAFGLLAGPDGGYAFAEIRAAHPSAALAAAVLILALVGAGSKAGLVPLHVWLPLAHPAAPSHVSALMSGVMTKVAVYGFVRIGFDLLGTPAWWWSMVVLALGGITAVMGVLYALMQHDLKRLLAYHTVENIGIIFIGLGLALAFKAHGMALAAALALTAGLLHVFNHSVFKSLLFFGAGAVLTATGERDMEHLGGLIHRMPQTAFAFLVGCAAISALPPLNGFVSEWLTFQANLAEPATSILGPEAFDPGGRRASRAVRGARRGLLREGVRRDFSRAPTHARGRARPRNRPVFAGDHVLFRGGLPGCRRPSGFHHRCPGAGGAGHGGRPHADAARRRLALDRAYRREPQLL
jgi:hydrogenase-4 component B